jgi:thiol-disulfide isomerase/thioredoxin
MKRLPHISKRLGAVLLLGALAAAGLALLPLESRSQQQQPTIEFVRDPDPAPAIKATDLDGHELTLDKYKGKVVLLNFWATWCGPCRAEIADLIKLQNAYKDQMQIIGMAVDVDDENDLRAVVKDEGINYPVAVASGQARWDYGGISALPTVFIINQEGKVVQKHVGLFNPVLYEVEVRALANLPVNVKVETFEDTGEIFLKHADRATSLPGVNTSKLTQEQRMVAMRKMNAENCTCGCKMTLAQCRIYDPACKYSKDRAQAIVKEAGEPTPPAPGKDNAAPAKDDVAPEKTESPAAPESPASPATPSAQPSPAPGH